MKANLRPCTEHLIAAARLNIWPSPAVMLDFGLDSNDHYRAIATLIRNEMVTPEELDKAMGNGAELNKLVRRIPGDAFKDLSFDTVWDQLKLDTKIPERLIEAERER